MNKSIVAMATFSILAASCDKNAEDGSDAPFASRYQPLAGESTLLTGATVIDASGMWVTPGIIDVHSHLGVYPSPSTVSHSDGNEATAPVTAEIWAEHSVWPQDPGFPAALAGGITSL